MNIKNGIKLHFIKSKKFKTTVICILIRRPLLKDEVTKNVLIAKLLSKGSKRYETIKQINSKTEKMYGSLFDIQVVKKSEEQIIQFYLETLSSNVDKNLIKEAFEFLNEVIFKPNVNKDGFLDENLQIEKDNVKRNIENRINDKSEYAKLRCIEEMCQEEPFGIYADGYLEYLDNITSFDLYNHYKHILNTSPIEIIVIGDEEENYISQLTKDMFKEDRKNVIDIEQPKIICEKTNPKEIYEQKEVSQGKICMGFRCCTENKGKELYSLIILNEIFGGGSNSKLFLNVREKESLCYFISSFVFRFKSIIFVQSGVDEKNFSKVKELIIGEIEKLKTGDFSEDELVDCKKNIIKKFKTMEDSQSATIDYYISQYLIDDKNTLEDAILELEKITKKDIVNISKNIYLDTCYFLENGSN